MAWTKGADLMDAIIDELIEIEALDEDTRQEIYERIIPLFEERSATNLELCCDRDEAFEVAFHALKSDNIIRGSSLGDDDEADLDGIDMEDGFGDEDYDD